MLCKTMVWWVYVFGVYPPLELVNWLSTSPLVVHECSPLVVLDDLLYISPLQVHQFCLCVIETGLPVVLIIPTVFHQLLKMAPQALDVVVPLLSLLQTAQIDRLKIWMKSWCYGGRTLLYPQPCTLLLCLHISGDTGSDSYLVQFTIPLTHVVPRFFLNLNIHEWKILILEGKVVFYWYQMLPPVLCMLTLLGCVWTVLINLIPIWMV